MKSILTFMIIGMSYTFSFQSFGQVKNLYPTLGNEPNLSPKVFRDFETRDNILNQISKGTVRYENLTQSERSLLRKYGEVYESPWDILGGGCSWYCGGGPQEVTASSSLPQYKSITYSGENAHDKSFKTAWVEGVKGNGIGEYLLYKFGAQSPRITKIQIYNGYVKSAKAWQDNGRVKSLNMYINDQLFATMHLEDTKKEQIFSIDPLGMMDNEMVLKFEITEVYPGNKYEDVAITDLFFDGLDVHCFAEGTSILMADGTPKSIELLKEGDIITSYDSHSQTFTTSKVLELANAVHCDMLELTFDDGEQLTTTPDHPLLTKNQKWGSFHATKTMSSYDYDQVISLEKESQVYEYTSQELVSRKIISVASISNYHKKTYTIVELEKGDTFFANGIAVGVEGLKSNLSISVNQANSNESDIHKVEN